MKLAYVLNDTYGQSSCSLCFALGIWNVSSLCLGKLENLPSGDFVGKSLCPECAAFIQRKYDRIAEK